MSLLSMTSVLHELGRYFYFNTVRLLVENWARVLKLLIAFPSYLFALQTNGGFGR